MTIQGYSTHGAHTYGAELARADPDGMPDGVNVGEKVRVPGSTVVLGTEYLIERVRCRIVGAKKGTGFIFDTRRKDAAWLEKTFPEGRLFLWRGRYWRVVDVNGVFVTAAYFGTSKRVPGWVLYTRNGFDLVRPADKN